MWISRAASLAAVVLLPRALGADVLKTNGFSDCSNNAAIKVNNVDVSFDRSSNMVTFDVSGSSSQAQKVTASLVVTAYGKDVYQKDFDPCDESTKVDQLCPGVCPNHLWVKDRLTILNSPCRSLFRTRLPVSAKQCGQPDSVDCLLRSRPGRTSKIGA